MSIFSCPLRTKVSRRDSGVQAFCRRQDLGAGRIHSARACVIRRGPRTARPRGAGKKKMRTLGTVQLPTEAFMAVLKLDEE